jgi:hypothetical protein
MLARCDQRLRDRPVQRVADHDAHRIDRRILGDGFPAGQRFLEPVSVRGILGQRYVSVRYRRQADRREPAAENGIRLAVPRSVTPASHPGPDDRDGDLLHGHDSTPFGAGSAPICDCHLMCWSCG